MTFFSQTRFATQLRTFILIGLSLTFFHDLLLSQSTSEQIQIDDSGKMIWKENGKEVTGFGVNYTVPFAYAYRNGKKMGVDLKAAIDQDVYQFARLGFDLFRVHVWDTEISDTLGNLIQNEHLELFDYLLAQLKKHHINAIITPIAYWGNGWPERDEVTPGFSHKYGKGACLVNPDAIKAQVNYLRQFASHVNPYLGVAYKNEPSILAFEVCNEPHHEGTPTEVTSFVRKMKDAIRQTGCTKPVFYNVSHKIQLADAYFAAGIDGGTFQWYPTGLGFQKELGGNMLPNVDRYTIPFDDVLKKSHAARIVYEFDAADMAKNYLYPAMARSFRTAGIQLATQFAWDPTFTAPYNTEYNTHFMNLLYAPQKALSLMICSEIFRTIPMYTDYGVYPDNTRFGPFHVSYEDNLAEMVSDEKFIYTNNTTEQPPAPNKLEMIAGWGNSPMVEYEGTGAYFLDKVGDQIWRLEIMPDAVQVDNLFGRNSLDKTVAVIKQETRKMKFNLPGFEDGFSIESVDWHDSIIYRETKDKTVALKPGVYLLMGWKYVNDDSLILEAKKQIDLENPLVYPKSPDSLLTQTDWATTQKSKNEINNNTQLHLLDASNFDDLNKQWLRSFQDESSFNGKAADGTPIRTNIHIHLDSLGYIDSENKNGSPIADYTMRHYFKDQTAGPEKEWKDKKILVLNATAPSGKKCPVQVSLISSNGTGYGYTFEVNDIDEVYTIQLENLKPVPVVLMPRPYPTFLPYYSAVKQGTHLDLSQVESIEVSIGPGIPKEDWKKPVDVFVKSVWLE